MTRPRHRHEPPPVPAARVGRHARLRPRQGDDRRADARTPARSSAAISTWTATASRSAPIPARTRPRARSSPAAPRATATRATPRKARPTSTTCSGCCASSRPPRTWCRARCARRAGQADARYGVIYFGSTAPAMDEAIHMIADAARRSTCCACARFPFHQDVDDFIADHDFVFVVEQNRDAQLRSLIVNECGIDPARSWCRCCTTTARRSPRASSPPPSASASTP